MKVAITSSSAAVNGAGSGGCVTPAFFSASFKVSISILARAQIGTGRFVDQLLGDRLALGNFPALAVDGHGHLLVERLDQQCRQVLRARSARVAGLAFLESAVHRWLAAADLVIALVLGHLARGHGGLLLPKRRSVPFAEPCVIVN